jgi:hypothetical protein
MILANWLSLATQKKNPSTWTQVTQGKDLKSKFDY